MKTNKEIIDALQAYFLKQDHATVARALAGMIIDINRMFSLDQLPQEEADNLIDRMKANRKQLQEFIKNGEGESFKIVNVKNMKEKR